MSFAGIKRTFATLLGPERTGRLEFLVYPSRRNRWGGPFNGQEMRLALARELLERIVPDYIVETGTYRGDTTAWFAEQSRKRAVYSVEVNPRHFGFARAALARHRNVVVRRGHSPEFLRDLLADAELAAGRGLFYLDAHWQTELPLVAELETILGRAERSIVWVDDFAVPGEPEYRFDTYEGGLRLEEGLIRPVLDRYGAEIFYPATPATRETAARRGCCVIARDRRGIEDLSETTLLRR